MFKNTKTDDETRWIRSDQIGRGTNRGPWATACFSNGEYGVMMGVTQGASQSAGFFIAEPKFAEFRENLKSAPPHFKELFEDASARLPQLKLRMSGLRGAN